jgi:hypothetical protein
VATTTCISQLEEKMPFFQSASIVANIKSNIKKR